MMFLQLTGNYAVLNDDNSAAIGHITGQRSSWIVDMEIRYRAFEISCPNLVAKDLEVV